MASTGSGTTAIPVATIGTLLLGPGTKITHQAVVTIADHGCGISWTGEENVRFYAAGAGRSSTTRLAERQAEIWANPKTRLRMARHLYQMRFPGEDVARLSLNQLRGREGARVRRAYRQASIATGVPWTRRDYDRTSFANSDPINQALSVANSCLYGICHAAINAVGLNPALGFIHAGDRNSLVFDIADLYKADTSIPAPFTAVSAGIQPLERATRRACRDIFRQTRLVETISTDLTRLFAPPTDPDTQDDDWHTIWLWDPDEGTTPGGTNYDPDTEPWS